MTRRVVFVAFPDFQILDLTGPLEVFAVANRLSGHDPYATRVVTVDGAPVTSSSGLTVHADGALKRERGAVDTLVIVGGTGTRAAMQDRGLVDWLERAAPSARRTTSVCSGAFVLAAAGLLDGRRATTHWASCEALASAFPGTTVEPDRIFVRDGDVWTSAGVTAGMDLALALVEDDLGAELARAVARWLVMFVQRPGGQAQFSAQLSTRSPDRADLRELAAWMTDHVDADLSVTALARRSGMSVRHFGRTFGREFDTTPAAYVENLRVEAARRWLESSDAGLAEVARRCGFGTVETLHRAFRRRLGVSPGAYRHRFSARVPA